MDSANISFDVETLASQSIIYKVGYGISYYYTPFWVLFGLIGNTMSFAVMIQPKNRQISCCLYLAILAICDNLALFLIGYYWTKLTFETEALYRLECSLMTCLFYAVTQCGMLLIVATTVDRLLVVRYPLKAARLCNPYRTKIIIGVLPVVALVFNLPHIFMTEIHDEYICVSFQGNSLWIKAYGFLAMLFNVVVAFIGLLTMNSLIIATLRKRAKELRSSKKTKKNLKQHKDGQHKVENSQLTVMLLLVSFVFVILIVPLYLRFIVFTFVNYKEDPHKYALFILFYHLSLNLYITNSAINFFLYCIGAAKFRRDFKYFFCCDKGKKSITSCQMSATRSSGFQ